MNADRWSIAIPVAQELPGLSFLFRDGAPRTALVEGAIDVVVRTLADRSVDGSTGCEEPEPENRPPVIQDAAASPSSGFAPLQVAFSVTATDADTDDTLTYAWDFDGDGTTDSTAEDPTHTYTTAGDYVADYQRQHAPLQPVAIRT